jgi:hypothetical protein
LTVVSGFGRRRDDFDAHDLVAFVANVAADVARHFRSVGVETMRASSTQPAQPKNPSGSERRRRRGRSPAPP